MAKKRLGRRAPRVDMQIQNGDLYLNYIKVNAASTSATIIFGDAECIAPKAVSYTRGVLAQTAFAPPIVSPGPSGGASRA